MSHRSGAMLAACAAAAILPLFAQVPASKPGAATKSSQALPRTPDGHPDFQGFWSNGTLTPLERPKGFGAKEFYTDEEFAKLTARLRKGEVGEEADIGAAAPQAVRYDLELYGFDITKANFASTKRTSLIIGPKGTVPSMLPEARKRNAERVSRNKGHEFDSFENRPLQERCILMTQRRIPMLPAAQDNNLLQIVQGQGYVTLYHEIDHDTRLVPTDGRPHIPQSIRQWQGDSVGHWEGDTLVIDTTNFTGRTAFLGSSEKLHLIERFTRKSDDTLIYQFTAEDPATWDKPWTAEIPWTKTKGPVYEWACHEGNTMISTILKGARVAEEEAAKKAAK